LVLDFKVVELKNWDSGKRWEDDTLMAPKSEASG